MRTTLWLDVVLLLSVCLLETVRFTGLVVHEWLGLAIVAMVLAHLLFSWSWIATQSRRFFGRQTIRERVNYLINFALFFGVTGAIFSGVLISQTAIPALTGMKASTEMDRQWGGSHENFAHLVLILAGFHLAINLDWLLAAMGNFLRRFREPAL